VRRAPYSDNPEVGARGLRTQQRILDAALVVFGESGYERSTLDRIGQLAGCSRVSIYQYFSGKDDVFRHLAGQVARQMRASAEALAPLTADTDGGAALRAWVVRYTDIHGRYEAVFRAFGAAARTDEELAGGSARAGERNVAVFQSKLATTALPPRQLDAVVGLLMTGVTRTLDAASILRATVPDAYTEDRVADAITDVVHRALFGVHAGVNARASTARRPPALPIGSGLTTIIERADALAVESTQPGRRALASLLDAGRDVIVGRGYQGTRVDDVVVAAGVSHGAFYRYFENKDDFVHVIAARSLGAVSAALAQVPPSTDRAALRRWLREYNAVSAAQGAMIRIRVESVEGPLRDDRAATFDWGRRQLARALRDRTFGDEAIEGLVLLGVMEAFGSQPREAVEVDATVHIVERGFLGQP
jgi:AcrR family transcriptional regulator